MSSIFGQFVFLSIGPTEILSLYYHLTLPRSLSIFLDYQIEEKQKKDESEIYHNIKLILLIDSITAMHGPQFLNEIVCTTSYNL